MSIILLHFFVKMYIYCKSQSAIAILLYHGCCMLTNQIAQLEVGNFHNHLPRGGCSFMFYSFWAMVQVGYITRLHHSVSVSTRLTLPRACVCPSVV